MTFWKWSKTAANNGTADSTCPFPEGMAPSALNDGTRGMMAAAAKYRDDIAGLIVTGGTSTSYTVTSNQVFDTLAHMDGAMIAFVPHITSTGTQTFLNVDGLGAKTVRSAPGGDIPPGTLVQGTPYTATYNNTDGVFYLHGFYGNPYNVPLASGMDYWAPTAPNSSFAFPFGQAISRTTYSALYTLIGTTFGTGDGSTTFNLPDKRGRASACLDNMGGTDASRLAGTNCALAPVRFTLGAGAGEGSHTQTVNELVAHSHSVNINDPGHSHLEYSPGNPGTVPSGGGAQATFSTPPGGKSSTDVATTGISVSINNNGGGQPFNVVQPTILCNYIMRIL